MIQRRPRRAVAAFSSAFALGAWLGVRGVGGGAAPALAALAAAALALVIAVRAFRRGRWSAAASAAVALAALAFAFADARAVARRRMDSVEALREVVEERDGAVLLGRVSGEPSVRVLPHGGARLRFDFTAMRLPADPGDIPLAPTRIQVEWYGPESIAGARPPFPLPRAGEGWVLSGKLREVATRSAVPLLVLSRRPGTGPARREPSLDDPPWRLFAWRLRAAGSRAIGRAMGRFPDECALVRAMVLGLRGETPERAQAVFRASGTVHVLAISGLHVVVFCSALEFFLLCLGLSRRAAAAPLLPCLALYVLLTGAHPSAVRAGTMMAFVLVGRLVGRRSDAPTALFAAAAAILAADPGQIVDPGFLFSFACTAAILFNPLGGGDAAASVAAWFASVPLTAAYFGQIVPVALLCNLAVLPLAKWTVRAALCVLLAAFALPDPLCEVAGWACARLVWLMEMAATLAAAVPGAVVRVRPWPPAAVAAWYAALLASAPLLRLATSDSSRSSRSAPPA